MPLLNFVGSRGGGGGIAIWFFFRHHAGTFFVFVFVFLLKGEGVGQTHPKKHKKQLLKIMKILIGESVGRSVPITFNFTVNFFLQILYFNVLNAPKKFF